MQDIEDCGIGDESDEEGDLAQHMNRVTINIHQDRLFN